MRSLFSKLPARHLFTGNGGAAVPLGTGNIRSAQLPSDLPSPTHETSRTVLTIDHHEHRLCFNLDALDRDWLWLERECGAFALGKSFAVNYRKRRLAVSHVRVQGLRFIGVFRSEQQLELCIQDCDGV
jgi:hypothetical protein